MTRIHAHEMIDHEDFSEEAYWETEPGSSHGPTIESTLEELAFDRALLEAEAEGIPEQFESYDDFLLELVDVFYGSEETQDDGTETETEETKGNTQD